VRICTDVDIQRAVGWPELLTVELFIICILCLGLVEMLLLPCSAKYLKPPYQIEVQLYCTSEISFPLGV
jgi:hypothetical protein